MRRLTADQIDCALAALRGKNAEYVCVGGTGRVGAGYAHRDGALYRIGVDDECRGTYEIPINEGELRHELASIDLDDLDDQYRMGALRMMGLDLG